MRYCLSTLYKCAHSKRAQLTVTVLQLDAGGNAQGSGLSSIPSTVEVGLATEALMMPVFMLTCAGRSKGSLLSYIACTYGWLMLAPSELSWLLTSHLLLTALAM